MLGLWSVVVKSILEWLEHIDNHKLDVVVNLFTITVIVIGLTDWSIRKFKERHGKKQTKGGAVKFIAGTQRPFKTVKMLENPMEAGEKLGELIEEISEDIGGNNKMRKFFKWVWYNKEQLFSIAYSIMLMVLSQIATWTDAINSIFPNLMGTGLIVTKIVVGVLSIALTALTVRNICVKYGLSSLNTIDKVLSERAAEAAKKLSPEQKKTIKNEITTLQMALSNAKKGLTDNEKALAQMITLHNADVNLVHDYDGKKKAYEEKIAEYKTIVSNLEKKLANCKAQLN